MSNALRRWSGRAIGVLFVATLLALVLAWQRHAQRVGVPDMVALLSTPVGTLLTGDRANPPQTKTARVTAQPLTGGEVPLDRNTRERPAPKAAAPKPKVVNSPILPRAVTITAPQPPDGPQQREVHDMNGATMAEPPKPLSTAPVPPAMQPGAAIAKGRQAPALTLAITPRQIADLVAAGKCVVVVENEGHEVFFLDRPDGAFRPIKELTATSVSERYLAVTDLGLTEAWSLRLGLPPGQRFAFGLRFTRAFDEAILQQQFASLAARGIDFDQALAAGRVITTHGNIGPGLVVAIDRVSVNERPTRTD